MRSRKLQRGRGTIGPLWWRNALRASEIAQAVPEVIAHRTARMVVAGPVLSARDRREFTRMGEEKAQACGESLMAMALPMYALSQELALLAMRQWSVWAPLASLTASASPAEVAKAQSALMRGLTSAAGEARLADACSRVVQKGLAPVHRAVTRNAKRLRGVRTL